MPVSLFRRGENCAVVARADRAAFIVDAEDYFRHFMRACERAERDILILGWDFDSRTILDYEGSGSPICLGEFLNGLMPANGCAPRVKPGFPRCAKVRK